MLFYSFGVIVDFLMSQTEREILETLVKLENAAAKMPTSDPKPDLRPMFARLEALAAQLPKETDTELLHFLHRKSYQKARVLLEQR
jgi:hypothetical protein